MGAGGWLQRLCYLQRWSKRKLGAPHSWLSAWPGKATAGGCRVSEGGRARCLLPRSPAQSSPLPHRRGCPTPRQKGKTGERSVGGETRPQACRRSRPSRPPLPAGLRPAAWPSRHLWRPSQKPRPPADAPPGTVKCRQKRPCSMDVAPSSLNAPRSNHFFASLRQLLPSHPLAPQEFPTLRWREASTLGEALPPGKQADPTRLSSQPRQWQGRC